MQISPEENSWLSRLLAWNGRMVVRYRNAYLIGGGLLVVFSAWFAWQNLGFKTSGSDLIGSDNPVHQRQLAYQAEFRQQEDFVILLTGTDPEQNTAAVEALAEAIRADPLLAAPDSTNLFYKADTSQLRQSGLLYLPTPTLLRLRDMLGATQAFTADGPVTIERILAIINQGLTPGRQGGDADALDFLPGFLAAMETALITGEAQADPSLLFGETAGLVAESEYLAFNDSRALLLLLTPLGTQPSPDELKVMIDRLRAHLDALRPEFPEVQFGLTGEPVLSADEKNTYKRDTSIALGITVAVVFLIFAYAYRQVARPLLKIAVLLSAIVVALAFTAATVGHLNILSVAFIVMILGLGDDFAIYVITRYEEERAMGQAPGVAMENAMIQAGHAVVMASLTVAISFLTMIFTGFIGLAEMGIIASGGILLCALLCLTFLPALLLCQKCEQEGQTRSIQHRITPLLQTAERAWLRHAGWVLAISAVLVGGAGLSAFRIQAIPEGFSRLRQGEPFQQAFAPILRVPFQYDLLAMQNPHLESVQTVRELNQLQSIYFSAIVVDSEAELRRLAPLLAAQPTVATVVSLLGSSERGTSTLPEGQEAKLPTAKALIDQARRLQVVPSLQVDLPAIQKRLPGLAARLTRTARLVRALGKANVADTLDTASQQTTMLAQTLSSLPATEAAARLGAFQEAFGTMFASAIQELGGMQAERMLTLDDLPASLAARYRGKNGHYLLEVYPAEDLRDKATLERFNESVLAIAPQATGTPIELALFVDLLKASYLKAALYAFLFVAFLVAIYFRSWRPTLLCLLPLCCGVVVLLGFMSWTGLAFNLANIITLPLIIGIGVDNGILILQRFRKEPEIALFRRNTGRAILMSNLSTIAGFAALSVAQHQGIASLGQIMTIGVGAAMLFSLITLPALIHWLKVRHIAI